MPYIEYLGFVVRQQEKDPENIVAVCVAKLEESGGKKLWKAYPLGKTQFIPMLFVVSVLIREKLAHLHVPESGIPEDGVLLKKPDPCSDFMLSYLSDVWRKGGRYKKVYEDLRHATRFFFCPYGQKNSLRFRAPQGGLRPSQIFFWTIPDFGKKTSLKELPKTSTELNKVEDPPQSNQDILPGICELAEKVRLYLAHPDPWQDLYKKALALPKDLPKCQIPLYGSMVGSDVNTSETLLYKEQHLQLSEAMTRHGKILLTGPAGSGKTTVQKMLIAEFLGPNPPISGCIPIFVSLKYAGIGGKSITELIVDSVVKEILSANSVKSTIQQQIDIRRAHYGDINFPKPQIQTGSTTDIVNSSFFKTEIRESFTSDKLKNKTPIVLLLDGFNELPEAMERDAVEEIQKLSDRIDTVIISSRSYGTGFLHLLPKFTRYELEELSNPQIIEYLNFHFNGKGEEFFNTSIVSDGRILSMARVPFYLELIVAYRQEYPHRRLPNCPAPLLKFFISAQYDDEEKQKIKGHYFPYVTNPQINLFLSKTAHRLIQKGKEEPETVLSFPEEVMKILPEFSIEDLVKTAKVAELFGFLDKSGYIPEEVGGAGAISFRHDNIRDYFAAIELKKEGSLEDSTIMKAYLEHTKWDNSWLMLYGILENEKQLEKSLSTMAKLDPLFSCHCLVASASANKKSADILLNYFDLSRISLLTTPKDEDYSFVPNESNYAVLKTIGPAMSRIYSLYPVQELLNLYSRPSTNQIIKAIIPRALLYAIGEHAIDYFGQIIHERGLKTPLELFYLLGTCKSPKAYRLLAETYIQAVEEGSRLRAHLALPLWSFKGYVPIDVVLEFAERYYEIRKPISKLSLRLPRNPLITPLEKGLAGKTNDWLRLRTHPDSDISTAARKALFSIKHPTFIADIVNDCKALKPKDFKFLQEEYYRTFLKSGTPGAKQLLFKILKRAVKQNAIRNQAQPIISLLLEDRNKMTIKRLVRLGLQGTDWLSLCCLSECFSEVPDETERVVTSEMHSSSLTSESLRRAQLVLALRGDKTMKTPMVSVLKEVVSIFSKNPKLLIDEEIRYRYYFSLLCDALICVKAVECKSILEYIVNHPVHVPDSWEAQRALECLGNKTIAKKKGTEELIYEIKSTPEKNDRHSLIAELSSSLRELSIESFEGFLGKIREITETAINQRDKNLSQCFYYIAEKSRDMYPMRRFLDIFAGWPTIPPQSCGTL